LGPLVTSEGGRDPILVSRGRYQRLSTLGLRLGYLLLGVASVAFLVGAVGGFASPVVTVSIVGLVGACVILPPAIVVGYAVKAAEREDRRAGRLPGQEGTSGSGDSDRQPGGRMR
jgi:hypothetical protein